MTPSSRKGAISDFRAGCERAWEALNLSITLFIVAAGCACFLAWQSGARDPLAYVLASANPALASVLLLAAGVFRPALFPSAHLEFPQNVTLPVVYMGLLWATKALEGQTPLALQRLPDVPRYDQVWNSPYFAMGVAFVQFLVLSFLLALGRPNDHEEGAPLP